VKKESSKRWGSTGRNVAAPTEKKKLLYLHTQKRGSREKELRETQPIAEDLTSTRGQSLKEKVVIKGRPWEETLVHQQEMGGTGKSKNL